MSTHAIDDYVRRVMNQVPAALPERDRIEQDLHAHLVETVEAEGDEAAAIRRAGSPEAVARGYLDEVPRSYASVGSRVAAFLVDLALGLAIMGIVGGLVAGALYALQAQGPPLALPEALLVSGLVAVGLCIMLLSVAYFPVMEWQFGQTLGKRILGIHVVQEDGRRITGVQAIVRRIPFFLEFFFIDAIVALFTERRQRAFDLVARTVVTRVDAAALPAGAHAPQRV